MRADGADELRGADAVVCKVLVQAGGAETLYEVGILDTSAWTQKDHGLTYRHTVPNPDQHAIA